MQYIAAHPSKIHSLEWDQVRTHRFVTSSQDHSCKIFDVREAKKPEKIINSKYPVWRAKFVPFGNAIITATVPARGLVGRSNDSHSLLLWNLGGDGVSAGATPVHTFLGHTSVILDFDLRRPRLNNSGEEDDYWLITFSRDNSLRFFAIDAQMEKLCKPVEMDADSLPPPRPSPSVTPHSPQPVSISKEDTVSRSNSICVKTLQEEFSLMNLASEDLDIVDMDPIQRSCLIIVDKKCKKGSDLSFQIKVSFPIGYPNRVAPSFSFCEPNNIETEVEQQVLSTMRKVAGKQVEKDKMCLEPAIRRLEELLKNLSGESETESRTSSELDNSSSEKIGENVIEEMASSQPPTDFYTSSNKLGSQLQDISVPFPRTSGARFCGPGYLVCFARPSRYRTMTKSGSVTKDTSSSSSTGGKRPSVSKRRPTAESIRPLQGETPRSLSALGGYLSSFASTNVYNSTKSPASLYYEKFQENKQKRQKSADDSTRDSRRDLCGPGVLAGFVHIFDASTLLPVSKVLARRYNVNPKDPVAACAHNAALCAELGYLELVRTWRIVFHIAVSVGKVPRSPFQENVTMAPVGRKLLENLIDYHARKVGDVQTAAVICCIFSMPHRQPVLQQQQLVLPSVHE
jgi:hypothetical protein